MNEEEGGGGGGERKTCINRDQNDGNIYHSAGFFACEFSREKFRERFICRRCDLTVLGGRNIEGRGK
jgi:hypothetical protein